MVELCLLRSRTNLKQEMENSFLAMKVIFCNQFKDIADLYGVNYDAIRDGFVLDERVGESHTRVFDDYRGYDSKYLNKDIPAIVSAIKEKNYSPFIMETVDEINKLYRS
jgi:UDPglucose 6-dehydrogenase